MSEIQKKYELQAIGRLLADKDAYFENSELFDTGMFYYYSEIFDEYVKEYAAGRKPTLTKFISLFPQRQQDIIEAVKGVDYSIEVHEIAAELSEMRKVRVIDTTLTAAAMKKGSEEKMAVISEMVAEVASKERASFETGFEAAIAAVKQIESKKQSGVLTGFRYFDMLTGGLQKTDLVIIAAETSQGKTSLALNITENVITKNHPVAFISLEMSNGQLITRMVCSSGRIQAQDIKHDIHAFSQQASRYKDLPLYIADVTNNNIIHILGLIRTAYIRYGVEVAVIDYLQLVGDKTQKSREQELGQITRSLKNIAKELKITVVALSQLSRPKGGANHYPTLSRLRDSGQIEEAADVVLFIHRPEAYSTDSEQEGKADIIIAKGRNYGTGKFEVKFEKEFTRFSDYGDRTGVGSTGGFTEVDEPF